MSLFLNLSEDGRLVLLSWSPKDASVPRKITGSKYPSSCPLHDQISSVARSNFSATHVHRKLKNNRRPCRGKVPDVMGMDWGLFLRRILCSHPEQFCSRTLCCIIPLTIVGRNPQRNNTYPAWEPKTNVLLSWRNCWKHTNAMVIESNIDSPFSNGWVKLEKNRNFKAGFFGWGHWESWYPVHLLASFTHTHICAHVVQWHFNLENLVLELFHFGLYALSCLRIIHCHSKLPLPEERYSWSRQNTCCHSDLSPVFLNIDASLSKGWVDDGRSSPNGTASGVRWVVCDLSLPFPLRGCENIFTYGLFEPCEPRTESFQRTF